MTEKNGNKINIKYFLVAIGLILGLSGTVYGLTAMGQEKFNVRLESDVKRNAEDILEIQLEQTRQFTAINGKLDSLIEKKQLSIKK